jgi:hypothetical protein
MWEGDNFWANLSAAIREFVVQKIQNGDKKLCGVEGNSAFGSSDKFTGEKSESTRKATKNRRLLSRKLQKRND